MNNYEDPIQFDSKKRTKDIELVYSNLTEISQGGPEVGNLTINGIKILGLFGGPVLIDGYTIYIPILVNKLLGRGFKLAVINAHTFEVNKIGAVRSIIFLDRIQNNKLFFFENLDKTKESSFELF